MFTRDADVNIGASMVTMVVFWMQEWHVATGWAVWDQFRWISNRYMFILVTTLLVPDFVSNTVMAARPAPL